MTNASAGTGNGSSPFWLEWTARAGYTGRGIVYVITGGLAFLAAFGKSNAEGTKGALAQMMGEPFGTALLTIVAIGLVAYSVWRAIQAFLDADNHGTDGKGLVVRTGLAISAATHLALALFVARLIYRGASSQGSGGGKESWTQMLLQQPFGQWLVAGVGAIVIGVGIAHLVKAWKKGFLKRLSGKAVESEAIIRLCQFGLAARGVVFGIIGVFLGVAAWQADADETRGLGGALSALQQQTYGTVLLAIVGAGLVAFGLYALVEARWRRIDAP